ncbi:MAG TPA: PQQ-binding-like beta-propeller repeat protein [Polyangiaceae bacterium]
MKGYGLSSILLTALVGGVMATASGKAGADGDCDESWPMVEHDISGSGDNTSEHAIGRGRAGRLAVDWTFDDAAAGSPVRPIHATPVIDRDGHAYVGDLAGTFWAIDANGKLLWSATTLPPTPEMAALSPTIDGPPTATIIMGSAAIAAHRPYVVFADANGRVYARDRATGKAIWTVTGLDDNPLGGVAGNAMSIVGDTILVGMSSLENYAFVLQQGGLSISCCSHRGGVVALDLDTGAVRWRYDTVEAAQPLPASQAPFTYGPSGADVWSQPTYDPESDTVYITTGQNLSPTADGKSTSQTDAFVAIDFKTGKAKWVHQVTQGDIWSIGVPNPNPVTGQPVDMDIGDSPKIYRLPDGHKVVAAGQKDGRYHVLDAATGAVVHTTQVVAPRNDLGGFQTGGAVGEGSAFQHGLNATAGFDGCNTGLCPYQGFDGVVEGLSLDGTTTKWSVKIPGSPLLGGVAVADGVVYFQSPVEEKVPLQDAPLWGLYAVDSQSGAVLKRMTFPGRAIASPVVAGGHVYVTSGNGALPAYGSVAQGTLMRLSAH